MPTGIGLLASELYSLTFVSGLLISVYGVLSSYMIHWNQWMV